MATILVDSRTHAYGKSVLDAMAAVCADLGHRCLRWHSLGNLDTSLRLMVVGKPDLVIIYNGLNCEHRSWRYRLERTGATKLYTEAGWYPQRDHWQVDPSGINANAGWVSLPLTSQPKTPLPIRDRGDLLVIMQFDCDTQLSPLMSPWFPDMFSLVKFLVEHSRLPLRLRKHPRHDVDPRIVELAHARNIPWDEAPTLAESLHSCRAVATINSSSGVEVLANRLPVLCYGRAVFRHPGAVCCLGPDGQQTTTATQALVEGRSPIFQEPLGEVLGRIISHQWSLADVPQRLPGLIDKLLTEREAQASLLHPRARGLKRLVRQIWNRKAA